MSQVRPSCLWCSVAIALVFCVGAHPAEAAQEAFSGKGTEQYLAAGDPKTALITLKNALRKSPEDPAIRVQIAKVYFQLGDAFSAEREARAARDLKAEEADYLPVLIDALLRQRKFKDLNDLLEPGDRPPVLESKVRTVLGIAAVRLGYDQKTEGLLRDAIGMDPSAVEPRIELARFLNGKRPEDAERVIDEAIAANPGSVQPIQVKGEMLWSRGNAEAAMRLFGAVLEIDPKNEVARLSRANVNIARGEFAAADADLDPILQAAPDNLVGNYLRGMERFKQRQYAEANLVLDRISSRFPVFPAGYFLHGATRLALGQSEAAEVMLDKYLRRVPADPEATRLIARAALQQHGAARAIDYLKPLVDKLPLDAKTLTLLGNAYMADGKPELALPQFEKVAALDPENTTIRARLAVAEIGAGRGHEGLEKLEEVFDGAAAGAMIAGPALVLAELREGHVDKAAKVSASLIERDGQNPLYQTLLGEVRAAQQDYGGAETAFHTALARNPDFAAATRGLAELYLKTGRTGDAKRVYGDLIANKPTDMTALVGLADVAIAEENWPKAIDLLNSARAAATYDPAPGLKLVGLYELRGDWNSAKALAAELYAQFPRDVNVVIALARTQLGSGDANGGISTYKLAYQLAPDSIAIRSAYLGLLKQAQYFREARDVVKEAVMREPRNTSLKLDLIRADAEVDGVDRAVSRAREFAASDPAGSIYDIVVAELYEQAGRGEEAVALLENAVAARSADAALAPALSRLYMRMGMSAKAEAFLKFRLKVDAKDLAARSELAFFYAGQKKDTAAIAEYSRLINDHPADATALNNLAWLYQRQGELGKARELAQRAFKISPRDASISDTLGWILLRQGEAESSVEYLKGANLSAPHDLDIQYHLVVALQRVGRGADARAILETLLTSGDSFAEKPEAEKLLQELKGR